MHRRFAALLVLFTTVSALAQSKVPSLCRPDEKVYFSCLTVSKRIASVCGAQDFDAGSPYLQYRHGHIGKLPELSFPKIPTSPRGLFEFSNSGFGAKASVRNLRFQIGEYTYVVFRSTAAFEPDTAGVQVSRDSKTTRIECKPNVYSGETGVRATYYTDEQNFYEIQNLGLPEVPRNELVN
jgi:hypothetical protein